MKIKGYCEDCEYRVDPEEGEDASRCHRFPPIVLTQDGDVYDGEFGFPEVKDIDFCGEWMKDFDLV